MLRVLHGSGLEPATLSTVDPCFGIYRLSMTDFNSLSLAVSKASSDNDASVDSSCRSSPPPPPVREAKAPPPGIVLVKPRPPPPPHQAEPAQTTPRRGGQVRSGQGPLPSRPVDRAVAQSLKFSDNQLPASNISIVEVNLADATESLRQIAVELRLLREFRDQQVSQRRRDAALATCWTCVGVVARALWQRVSCRL